MNRADLGKGKILSAKPAADREKESRQNEEDGNGG